MSEDCGQFDVVISIYSQYSVWLSSRPCPHGWEPVGFRGSREECLNYIETIWSDIAPVLQNHHN